MLTKFTTSKSVSETAAALEAAVQNNEFGVMHVHDLKETMMKKGVDFQRECLVFEVCQPSAPPASGSLFERPKQVSPPKP
jgi:uncharacterized protein (DUF302 family)